VKDINLIPKSYYLKKEKRGKRIIIGVSVFFISIVATFAICVPLYVKAQLQKEMNTLVDEVMKTTGYKANQDNLEQIKMIFNEREQNAKELNKNTFSALEILAQIEKSMPAKLFITDISLANESDGNVSIILSGNCATQEDIASFLYYLRKNKYFKDIYISSINKNELGQVLTQATPTPTKTKKSKLKRKVTVSTTPTVNYDTEYYNFNMSLSYEIQ